MIKKILMCSVCFMVTACTTATIKTFNSDNSGVEKADYVIDTCTNFAKTGHQHGQGSELNIFINCTNAAMNLYNDTIPAPVAPSTKNPEVKKT